MKTKVALKNSRSRLLNGQNPVNTTPGVERIHVIGINYPKILEIQVKCLKTISKVHFFKKMIKIHEKF